MKHALLSLLTFAAGFTAAAQDIPQTLEDGYVLAWNEEFNGTGAPDPSRWSFEQGFVRNNEWQWYQSDNAFQSDGSLVITARREDKPNPTYNAAGKHWGQKRKRIECTSACVITKDKYEFQYGRVLVRARIPASRGSWPAIWLLGGKKDYGWPSCGEIDMMEFYPKAGVRSLFANACWGNDNGGSVWDATAVPFTRFTAKDSLWATQFHVWRMDWDKDFIRLYVDDELLNEIDLSKTVNGRHGKGENPFRKPMYLLLNLAMGSSGGKVDEATLPVRYEIDYVRVYQQ